MGKDKKNDGDNAGLPTDMGSIFDQFKENITISRDEEGVIVRFKKLAPGMNMDMLKSMIENMMGGGGNDLMKRFTKLMNDEDEEPGDEEPGEEEEGESGPGFRVETLEEGSGFKLIPEDPADIDELHESIKKMFDPTMFANMMKAVEQLFGIRPQAPSSFDEDDEKSDKDKKRKGTDTNITNDYFYT